MGSYMKALLSFSLSSNHQCNKCAKEKLMTFFHEAGPTQTQLGDNLSRISTGKHGNTG